MWFPDEFQQLHALSLIVNRWVVRSLDRWSHRPQHPVTRSRGPAPA